MRPLIPLAFVLAAGCSGQIGETDERPTGCDPADPTCSPGAICSDADAPTLLEQRPIRRLSETEYHNTTRALFAGVPYEPTSLVPVLTEAGFENFVSNTRQVGERDVEAFDETVSGIAGRAAQDASFLAQNGCPSTDDELACINGFIEDFGLRALRRPLTEEQRRDYVSLAQEVSAEIDLAAGIETAIASFLMAPEFLYRVETRGEAEADPYAVASRMSYLLWQSMPDEELFAAAADGALATPEQREAQARRMLADPQATEALVDFHRQWFRFARMDESKYADKSPTLFPEWTPSLRAAVQEEVRRFVRHIAEGDATLAALYTDRTSFVNEELAAHYGVSAGDGWAETQLPEDERAGILTRANFLAGTGIAGHGSPVHRGIFVYESLLCRHIGGVPDDADTSVPEEVPEDQTTRELYETITGPSECRGCHAIVNPIGFTFEHYTSTGAFRLTENGHPVDASGALSGSDRSGTIGDAVHLSEEIAQSDVAHACAADRWTAYMLGRRLDGSAEDDACYTERIRNAFLESGGDMRELLITFVTQPEFVGGAR